MESRTESPSNPPHDRPAKLIDRYFEELMRLSYEHPLLMRNLVRVVGVSSLALLTAPFWSQSLGLDLSAGASVAAVGVGAVAALASGVSSFMQNRFFGLPAKDDASVYQESEFYWQSAMAKIHIEDGGMPCLVIRSDQPYDAGYVEGYILGEAIKHNLAVTDFLYKPMWLMGAPWSRADIKKYLDAVYAKIPTAYQDEIRGKVAGYNRWLREHYPETKPLALEYYLLLQLLPDIRNYNPFRRPEKDYAFSMPALPNPACTTAVLRLGDYTFFTRVLDWPSYGECGNYFLQIDRRIGDARRTIDIGIPLLTGALTVLNEDGLLVEMNVAHGDKVADPQGMPAVFFNRYCAEHASSVEEVNHLIAEQKPLGAYHLTASDGKEVQSFHFYQHPEVQGDHAIDILDRDKADPQLLVVANHGLTFKDSVPTVVNHRDSDQRKVNIHHLFSQKAAQDKFRQFIDKQKQSGDMPQQDLQEMKEFCLQVARLPLVSNCESVLCALYVYHHNQLADASVATDNLYAQKKELDEFKSLKRM